MKKSTTIFYSLMVSTLLFFAVTLSVHASVITFGAPTQPLGVGDEFAVTILLSSEGEEVNAVSGDITFDDTVLSVTRVLDAGSIVTGWVEAPHVSGNAVVFSGIMPGGYQGVIDPTTGTHIPGVIATIIFHVNKAGTGTVQFTDAHVYKNDGQGTEVPLQYPTLALSFASHGYGRSVAMNDSNAPEAFTPVIMSNHALYGGKFVVVFSATDKETSIDHYEVKEGDADWVRGESPYVLLDQKIKGIVKVKAIDLAGNYQIGTAETPPVSSRSALFIPLLVLIALCLLVYGVIMRYHKKNNAS